MTKDELIREVAKLQLAVESHEEQVKDLAHDLKAAEKKLADADKPKLTIQQFGDIEDAICRAVDNYPFDNYDQYEYEMSMEYDNKVELSHIEFNDRSDLTGEIYAKVESLFGVADESDDDQRDRE